METAPIIDFFDCSPIGIQTILDQFFHNANGTLNYLTSSDAIDHLLGEGEDLFGSGTRSRCHGHVLLLLVSASLSTLTGGEDCFPPIFFVTRDLPRDGVAHGKY